MRPTTADGELRFFGLAGKRIVTSKPRRQTRNAAGGFAAACVAVGNGYLARRRYARSSPSRREDSSFSAIFFLSVPLRNPRTECGCQPVAFISCLSEAPPGRFSKSSTLAVLLPRRATAACLTSFAACLGFALCFVFALRLARFAAAGWALLRVVRVFLPAVSGGVATG